MFEYVQINMNSEEPHIQMPGPERDSTLPNRNYALAYLSRRMS